MSSIAAAALSRKRPFNEVMPDLELHSPQEKRRAATPRLIGFEAHMREELEYEVSLFQRQLGPDKSGIYQHISHLIRNMERREDVLAELGAALCLSSMGGMLGGGPPSSYYRSLLAQTESFLLKRKEEHSSLCGEMRKMIPSGRTDHILMLFCRLLLPDQSGISKTGIYCIRKLLGPNEISAYLKPEHRSHILELLDNLEKESSFFQQQLDLHPSLAFLCNVDMRFERESSPSQTILKRWILKMLLSDVFQNDDEGVCYAIASYKFSLSNALVSFLTYLKTLLAQGQLKIGATSFNLRELVDLRLVRPAELCITTTCIPHYVPVVADYLSWSSCNIHAGPDVTTIDNLFFPEDVFSRALFCSYHQNTLQHLVIRTLIIAGLNGIDQQHSPTLKQRMIKNLCIIRPERMKDVQRKIFEMRLKRKFWLLDSSPAAFSLKEDSAHIDGEKISPPSENKRLQQVLTSGCCILMVDDDGRVERILSFERLCQLVLSIPDERDVVLDYTFQEQVSRLKRAFLGSMPDGFEEKHFGDVVYLPQEGGHMPYCLALWSIPYRIQHLGGGVSAQSPPADFIHSLHRVGADLPVGKLMLMSTGNHAFTARSGPEIPPPTIRQNFLSKALPNELLQRYFHEVSPQSARILENISTIGDFLQCDASLDPHLRCSARTIVMRDLEKLIFHEIWVQNVFKELGCLMPKKKMRVTAMRLRRSPTNPLIWARRLRRILIQEGVAVFPVDKIEGIIRRLHSLPAVTVVADPNYRDGNRGHAQIVLRDCLTDTGWSQSVDIRTKHPSLDVPKLKFKETGVFLPKL